jgi:hypothetical protein
MLLWASVAFADVQHVRITVIPDHAPDGSLWRVAVDDRELQPDGDLVYAVERRRPRVQVYQGWTLVKPVHFVPREGMELELAVKAYRPEKPR